MLVSDWKDDTTLQQQTQHVSPGEMSPSVSDSGPSTLSPADKCIIIYTTNNKWLFLSFGLTGVPGLSWVIKWDHLEINGMFLQIRCLSVKQPTVLKDTLNHWCSTQKITHWTPFLTHQLISDGGDLANVIYTKLCVYYNAVHTHMLVLGHFLENQG